MAAGNGKGIFLIILRAETVFFVEYTGTFFEDDTGHMSVFGEDLFRPPAVADHNAFFLHFGDLIFGSRHLFPAFQADHGDQTVKGADGGAGYIGRHIAAADHDDIAAEAA